MLETVKILSLKPFSLVLVAFLLYVIFLWVHVVTASKSFETKPLTISSCNVIGFFTCLMLMQLLLLHTYLFIKDLFKLICITMFFFPVLGGTLWHIPVIYFSLAFSSFMFQPGNTYTYICLNVSSPSTEIQFEVAASLTFKKI